MLLASYWSLTHTNIITATINTTASIVTISTRNNRRQARAELTVGTMTDEWRMMEFIGSFSDIIFRMTPDTVVIGLWFLWPNIKIVISTAKYWCETRLLSVTLAEICVRIKWPVTLSSICQPSPVINKWYGSVTLSVTGSKTVWHWKLKQGLHQCIYNKFRGAVLRGCTI